MPSNRSPWILALPMPQAANGNGRNTMAQRPFRRMSMPPPSRLSTRQVWDLSQATSGLAIREGRPAARLREAPRASNGRPEVGLPSIARACRSSSADQSMARPSAGAADGTSGCGRRSILRQTRERPRPQPARQGRPPKRGVDALRHGRYQPEQGESRVDFQISQWGLAAHDQQNDQRAMQQGDQRQGGRTKKLWVIIFLTRRHARTNRAGGTRVPRPAYLRGENKKRRGL
jgi:hypothetical protein